MSRIFLSHHHDDSREALALKQWLAEQDPPMAQEIFLDLDRQSGIRGGTRWKRELLKAKSRCEAAICLLSIKWAESRECGLEYRNAEDMGKQIFCARLEPSSADDLTSEWQRFDLIGEGEKTTIDIGDGRPPVEFCSDALYRIRDGIRGAGISAEAFPWPPASDPDPQPFRGWDPLQESDAGIFFGRDHELVLALDALRDMRRRQDEALFVVLGPSGSGKSSFLRAGVLPRLRREDRHFFVLDIVRPERRVLSGKTGLANAIHMSRRRLGLPHPPLGDIKAACDSDWPTIRELLAQCRQVAAARIPGADADITPPNIVLPVDQAEELFSADRGAEALAFLELIATLADPDAGVGIGLIVAATIRTDRYEPMQLAPALASLRTRLFGELKPMPPYEFREVVVGPARRFSQEVHQLRIDPALVDELTKDCGESADALPLLALTLARLFEDYGSGNELTLDQYRQIGGMEQVVQSQIDEVLSTDTNLRATQLQALRAAFIPWLATINPDTDQPLRRVARRSDLPENSLGLIDALVEKRLLTQDRRDEGIVVEVALESLLRQWKDLAGWLVEERESLIAATDLERAVREWDRRDRNDDWLLGGVRLATAEFVAGQPGFAERLALATDFLVASRRREDEIRETAAEGEHGAIARRLISEARANMTRQAAGGDAWAFQLLLAAHAIQSVPDDTAIREALAARPRLLKIIKLGVALKCVAFSPDGRHLVTGDTSGTVVCWDTASGQPIAPLLSDLSAEVNAVAFSPDGRRLATATGREKYTRVNRPGQGPEPDWSGEAQLWDADSGQPVGQALIHSLRVNGIAFSPDGRMLASASDDGTVQIVSVDGCEPVCAPFSGHNAQVKCVAFSPDGVTVASGGRSAAAWDSDDQRGTIYVRNIDDGRLVCAPLVGHVDWVSAISFSPDGQLLASSGRDKMVRVWDVRTGQQIGGPLNGHTGIEVTCVAFSPDGKRIASAGTDETVRIWDTRTGQQVGESLTGHTRSVTSVAFDHDGQRLASVGEDGTIRIWDARGQQPFGEPLSGHSGAVTDVAFNPSGKWLASTSRDRTLRTWDVRTCEELSVMSDSSRVRCLGLCLAFSPDGRYMATDIKALVDPDETRTAVWLDPDDIQIWDLRTGEPIAIEFEGRFDGRVRSLAFSPDGQRVAITQDSHTTVQIWDIRPGKVPVRRAFAHENPGNKRPWPSLYCVAFSASGRLAATAGQDKTVQVWDAHSGHRIHPPLTGHDGSVSCVAFSPDERRLVSASSDRTLRLWDTLTGQPLGDPLRGHTGAVTSVAFSPDGLRVASASSDRTVRLWHALTGQPLSEPLTGHSDAVNSVAFSPDGLMVASASDDHTVRLWPGATYAQLLSAKLTTNMRRSEWNEWVSPDIDYVRFRPDLPIPADHDS